MKKVGAYDIIFWVIFTVFALGGFTMVMFAGFMPK
jgi:hypothetical protein